MIWLGPLLVIAATLAKLNVWTPFRAIRQGNWLPVMLMAIGTTLNSITWEMWNYWSPPNNPNFWRYDLPYVHEFLVFEMPILGFSGYLFFGPHLLGHVDFLRQTARFQHRFAADCTPTRSANEPSENPDIRF